jgi:uncharacterized Zn-binding protein involved in type VI secretion
MPGQVRTNKDLHVGHASPSPNPFHQTPYAVGSPDVYANDENVVRIGDTTYCGDPAATGSPNVFANNIPVHRQFDATIGHGSWVPNAALTGSTDVIVNGVNIPRAELVNFAQSNGLAIGPLGTIGTVRNQKTGEILNSEPAAATADEAVILDTEPDPPPPVSASCTRANLGEVSAKYESRGGPNAIGNDSTGGWSYGTYQIATIPGAFTDFMNFLKKAKYNSVYNSLEAAGGNTAATKGTQTFQDTWDSRCNNDPDFAECQHKFIQAKYYDKSVAALKTLGIDLCDGTHCAGLQDAVWSAAVQHGPGMSKSIFEKALARTGKTITTVTDYELIQALYDERGKPGNVKQYIKAEKKWIVTDVVEPGAAYFGKSETKIRAAVVSRYKREVKDALALCSKPTPSPGVDPGIDWSEYDAG